MADRGPRDLGDQLPAAPPGWRGRRHRAMEHADGAAGIQDRARAGGGQRRGCQAFGGSPFNCVDHGRSIR